MAIIKLFGMKMLFMKICYVKYEFIFYEESLTGGIACKNHFKFVEFL